MLTQSLTSLNDLVLILTFDLDLSSDMRYLHFTFQNTNLTTEAFQNKNLCTSDSRMGQGFVNPNTLLPFPYWTFLQTLELFLETAPYR